MSNAIAYINFPLEDTMKCDLCLEQNKGVFRAASRKENFARHLRTKHDIQIDNIKVRCLVCGRISEKGRRAAWRDTSTHYRKQHPQLLQREIENKTEPQQPLPDKSNTAHIRSFINYHPASAQETSNRPVGVGVLPSRKFVDVDGLIDLSTKTQRSAEIIVKLRSFLPPAPTVTFDNPLIVHNRAKAVCNPDMLAVENLAMKKGRENNCHSTSKIFAAMGQMFDVVASVAADSQQPTTSTPEKKPPIANSISTTPEATTPPKNALAHVSRIRPKARPAIQRSWKRQLENPTPVCPSKKLHPLED